MMNSERADGLPLLLCFTNAQAWSRTEEAADRMTLRSPLITTPASWDELVASWNLEPAEGSGVSVQVEVVSPSDASRIYHLGNWSIGGMEPIRRSSVRGQKDELGEVKTDTLVLRAPVRGFHLRVEAHGELARHPERLRRVAVSLAVGKDLPEGRDANRAAWGLDLDVPERSQIAYAGGEGWCSPTSISMALAYWARESDRPELDVDVPEVARCVHDPGWPGTGNWSFNTAFAGTFEGITAAAARLRDLRAVEDLVARGIPVVMSVSAPALRGREVAPNSGHLIVCDGFTPDGDVITNDPWTRLEEGQRVRRVYARENVERAWEHAGRLAYLIAPSSLAREAFPGEWRGGETPRTGRGELAEE